jgi:hypothetical protein
MKSYLSTAKFLWLALFAVLGWSCEPSLKVSSDYDKSVSFGQFKTFSVSSSPEEHESISQLNHDRIVNAIRSEMIKKGFQEASASPDLVVHPVTIFKDKVSVSSTTNYYGYGGVYRPYYWGGGMGVSGTTNYDVQHYKDGSLIIDVVDANLKTGLARTGNKGN